MHTWTPELLKAELEKGHSVFLKLWKKGCGACKLSEPAIERIQSEDQNGFIFGQINVEDFPEILETSETTVVPAFFVFKNGELKGKFEGFKGLEKLKSFVQDACA